MLLAKTLGLFVVTAIAEIVGCSLPFLWLTKGGSPWLLLPAAVSLALFVWLLSLHPTAAPVSSPAVKTTVLSALPHLACGAASAITLRRSEPVQQALH